MAGLHLKTTFGMRSHCGRNHAVLQDPDVHVWWARTLWSAAGAKILTVCSAEMIFFHQKSRYMMPDLKNFLAARAIRMTPKSDLMYPKNLDWHYPTTTPPTM